ncbi:MAG: hypothetical protein IKD33_04180 [Bacteroidales bacterium]|nr:hypothetical protein [Bacteroidales bacterium]
MPFCVPKNYKIGPDNDGKYVFVDLSSRHIAKMVCDVYRLFIRVLTAVSNVLIKINDDLCHIIEKMVVPLHPISDTKRMMMKERLSNIIEATATMPMGVDKIIFFIDKRLY